MAACIGVDQITHRKPPMEAKGSVDAETTPSFSRFSRIEVLVSSVGIARILAHLGAGAVDAGTGLPLTVLGSISSIRVPSGSKRFAWRFPLTPVLISIVRE
jgi:hypothetical protein